MISSKRHTVRVVDHDEGWSALFANERATLQDALGGLVLDIQHVGSTAVPDLPAKPILDIAMSVRTLSLMPAIIERLSEIGYVYRGDRAGDGGHVFVRGPDPDIRTVHVHVVQERDSQWKDYLAFWRVLREDPDVRRRYADVKQALAKRFPDDRRSYTSSKGEFIREVLRG